jgi:hypothetical protein
MTCLLLSFELCRLPELHAWLDQYAPGWTYRVFSLQVSEQQQADMRKHNEEYAAKRVENGRGHVIGSLFFVLPDAKSAMLCRLTWG